MRRYRRPICRQSANDDLAYLIQTNPKAWSLALAHLVLLGLAASHAAGAPALPRLHGLSAEHQAASSKTSNFKKANHVRHYDTNAQR